MSEKYKMFRNYMTNELGITKGDIEAWAKESVATEVNKRLNGLDFEETMRKEIEKAARNVVYGGIGSPGLKELRQEIGNILAENLTVSVKPGGH